MDSEWFLKRRGEKNYPFSAEKQEKRKAARKEKLYVYAYMAF